MVNSWFLKHCYLNCYSQVLPNPTISALAGDPFGLWECDILQLARGGPFLAPPLLFPCLAYTGVYTGWHLSRVFISPAMWVMSNSAFPSLETCFGFLFQMLSITVLVQQCCWSPKWFGKFYLEIVSKPLARSFEYPYWWQNLVFRR